jgi:replicative DNA helicase
MAQIPQSVELEEGCIGCMLAQPRDAVTEFVAKYPAGPRLFWDERLRLIVETLISMVDEAKHIDSITLTDELKKHKSLEKSGGHAYLGKLWELATSTGGLVYYADQLVDLHVSRQLVLMGDKLKTLGFERKGKAALEEVEREVLAIGEEGLNSEDIDLKELVHGAILRLEESWKHGTIRGLTTGLSDLDKLLRGMKPGHLILIAARPSKGKTSLAMNIVESVAIKQQAPVAVFSMEMPREELVDRLLSSVARIPLTNFIPDKATNHDFAAITGASVLISASPIRINDTGGLTIGSLKALSRRMVQRHKSQLIVVDYIQLMSGAGGKNGNREQDISEISRGLKAMAKELKLPVLALSQLNRQMETDGREPRLSDLRESGSLEQDADVVVMIHDTCDDSVNAREVKLLVRKNRGGATGVVPAMFLRDITRFECKARITKQDEF